MREILNLVSLWLIPCIVLIIFVHGIIKKVPCYEVFTDGAKEGFFIAVRIMPYLIAIVVAVSMFRASGAIDFLSLVLKNFLNYINVPVDTIPIMITRSLSGSAVLGLLSDVINSNGVNSYAAKLSAVMVGSSETTFYVLAVYFGSIGVKKVRYALLTGLLADIFGIFLAITVAKVFFS